MKQLEDDNTVLNNKVLKKDTILTQELTNKEIMFIRLQNLEKENDKLVDQIRNGNMGAKGFFTGLINKISPKNAKTVVPSKPVQSVSLGSMKTDGKTEILDTNEQPKDMEFASKTLDKIKQKKMNNNKKLASDNIDYEPVFK
jgi:hypothetical protein